jgi:amino-acid N-acetyltransferase
MEHRALPAQAHDLPAALDLLRRVDLPLKGVAEEFRHFVVVRDDATVVGVAGLETCGAAGLLRSVAVDPDFRGQGIASALVEGVGELARRVGVSDLYLLTTTARDYFSRRGFADCPREEAPPAIRETWEFRSGCPTTSAFMRRRL